MAGLERESEVAGLHSLVDAWKMSRKGSVWFPEWLNKWYIG